MTTRNDFEYHLDRCMSAIQRLVKIAKEIADDSEIDLLDSERRIRLYSALNSFGALDISNRLQASIDFWEDLADKDSHNSEE